MTELICSIGKAASVMGIPGLLCSIAVAWASCASIYALLVLPRTAEIWEGIPVLGLSVRWLMAGRTSGSNSGCVDSPMTSPPAEAIEVAAKASGFQSVAVDWGSNLRATFEAVFSKFRTAHNYQDCPLSLLFRVGPGKACRTRTPADGTGVSALCDSFLSRHRREAVPSLQFWWKCSL